MLTFSAHSLQRFVPWQILFLTFWYRPMLVSAPVLFPESAGEVRLKTSFSVHFLREALQILRECADSRTLGGTTGALGRPVEKLPIASCALGRVLSPHERSILLQPLFPPKSLFLQKCVILTPGSTNGLSNVKAVRAA